MEFIVLAIITVAAILTAAYAVVKINTTQAEAISEINKSQSEIIKEISSGLEKAHSLNSAERADLSDRLMETIGIYHMSKAAETEAQQQQELSIENDISAQLYTTEEEEDAAYNQQMSMEQQDQITDLIASLGVHQSEEDNQ